VLQALGKVLDFGSDKQERDLYCKDFGLSLLILRASFVTCHMRISVASKWSCLAPL
jgi:hypothetical protein